MTQWQYMIRSYDPDNIETSLGGLFRLREGDPLLLLEFVTAEGLWKRSDALYRYRMMGSTDKDFIDVTPDRAQKILEAWVARGRIEKMPDPDQDDRPDEDTIAKFRMLEDAARARWRAVSIPEGAQNISLQTSTEGEAS